MFKLVVMNGDATGTECPLTDAGISIGRRADNAIALAGDMKVSRSHARVFADGDQFLLEDVGSANGTFLEQRRIYDPTPLALGDRFRIGRTWLHIVEFDETLSDSQAARQVVLVESDPGSGISPAEIAVPESLVYSLDAVHPSVHPADAVELQRRLAVMFEFGLALVSILELPRLLSVAADRIMEVIPAEQLSLLLVDPGTGELQPRVVRSRVADVPEGNFRISRHMVTRALDERLAVLTTDATTDARFSDADSVRELRIRSAICAPLLTPSRAVGVIYLHTQSGTHIFSEPDVHLVAGIAALTAVALENARLYTDLRKAYDHIQSAQESLLRSERAAAIGVLSASIAHDMANIVSPLKPLIGILAEGRDPDGRAQEVLLRQTDRLVALVERIQAFGRTRAPRLAPTHLNQVVENTLALVRTELLHRQVEVKVSLCEASPQVMADSAQLERALLNLIVNAAEAMEDSEIKLIELTADVEEGDGLIRVKDTGPGIPVEIQEKLFEAFFTTKDTGTGLGLYSCRRIVEDEHGGSLELDSRQGAGTTITMRLPLAPHAEV